MPVSRKWFYDLARQHFGAFKQSQVDGFEVILGEWDDVGLVDLRWLAYMLATVWHETAATMQPIKERGSTDYFIKRYWMNKKIRDALGNTSPQDAVNFCGKGYVQITGRRNYTKMSQILYNDKRLVFDPNLAMDTKVAVAILFEGMTTAKSFAGDFTGKSLNQYFNKSTNDPINARRIINGLDKAKLIAGYYQDFLLALI